MKTTTRWLSGLMLLLVCGCGLLRGDKFEPGGAYAKTETSAAMPDLYVTDAAFDLAFKSLDTTFKFERDNRAALWVISPKIKHALDGLRVEASQVWLDYAAARQAYLSVPIAANLDTVRLALAKLQQINATALAVIATKGNPL